MSSLAPITNLPPMPIMVPAAPEAPSAPEAPDVPDTTVAPDATADAGVPAQTPAALAAPGGPTPPTALKKQPVNPKGPVDPKAWKPRAAPPGGYAVLKMAKVVNPALAAASAAIAPYVAAQVTGKALPPKPRDPVVIDRDPPAPTKVTASSVSHGHGVVPPVKTEPLASRSVSALSDKDIAALLAAAVTKNNGVKDATIAKEKKCDWITTALIIIGIVLLVGLGATVIGLFAGMIALGAYGAAVGIAALTAGIIRSKMKQ